VVLDSGSGNCTLTAAAACQKLTCTGYTGTLAFGAYTLTNAGTAPDVTLASGMTVTGTTGGIALNAAATITCATKSIPTLTLGVSGTVTLGDDHLAGTLMITAVAVTLSGAHDISCGTLQIYTTVSARTVKFVAGRKLTVSTAMLLMSGPGTLSIQSATGSASTYFSYTGADATTLRVCGVAFQDVDFYTYSTNVRNLDNWCGTTSGTGMLGITNRTSVDLATAAQAGNILSGTTISGVAGTFVESDRNTDPGEAYVLTGHNYKILNAAKTASYSPSADYPAVGDVRDGVTFDTGARAGNLTLPAVGNVADGVTYGTNGTELEGTLAAGGGAVDFPDAMTIGA
jgi:hypothetical protein